MYPVDRGKRARRPSGGMRTYGKVFKETYSELYVRLDNNEEDKGLY